ncbi:MAG TPA: TMEM175 family protein [Rhodopila sp.]|uniref:TMEM175 family protein n=1 Tax=Rhodopila sp. TaxID=2480087 RepID=UPI002C7D1EA4|nr:TMEM175 family protein [Rhodopila sp.]HVY17136.1 TMEM175 family protein [Rhodopila sp.]
MRAASPERLSVFSDGIFAVLITVLVLDLRPPEDPTFAALLSLWHVWLSYAVSYLFIAIVWTNHHHLMRYAVEATPRLVWFNFGHLFSASLLPLSTAWMAVSKLGAQPVSFYAAIFFLVNATYVLLIWELINPAEKPMPRVRKVMLLRAVATLCLFGGAALIALKYPLTGLGICVACLAVYLKPAAGSPEAGSTKRISS